MMSIKKYLHNADKKEWSWILYDCGNSAYSMAITTALFPVYFGMVKQGSSMDLGYFSSFAGILVAMLSPILGTIADYRGYKKRFFSFFALLGVLVTAMLAFVPTDQWFLLGAIYTLSAIGFAGANVFYDAFLVDVTNHDRMDRVSTRGFAMGYIVSVIPFILCLIAILIAGMDSFLGYKVSFFITALWWGILTIPMFKNVIQKHYIEPEEHPIRKSFRRLFTTFKHIRSYKLVFSFLIAYFLYIDGVDTIIKMAVPYVQDALSLGSLDSFMLLAILLVIQVIAFPCALLYGWLADKFTAKTMLIVAICTYLGTIIFAYFITELWHIFILGGLIGSAQGGVQALSRSYYAKIIPKDRANEFFGFYNIFGKFAAIIGPFLMSLTTTVTGVPRYSILAIAPLFLVGLIFVIRLPKEV